jgi:hypothetical protein
MNANQTKTESKSRETDTELTDAELANATGGNILNTIMEAYLKAAGKHVYDAIHLPKPKMAMHMR